MSKRLISTIDYFNRRAKRYAKSVQQLPNARSLDLIPYCFLFNLAETNPKKIKILDAFAGTGYISNSFNAMNADFIQVDASTGMLGENDTNKRCTKNDFVDIQQEFGNNYFDYIISHGGFHHVVETDKNGNILKTESYNRQKEVIKRLISLLKPNGYLVIADIPCGNYQEDLGCIEQQQILLSDLAQYIGEKKIETIMSFLQIQDTEKTSLSDIKTKIDRITKEAKKEYPIPRHFFDNYISTQTELGHIANYPDFDLIDDWTKGLVKKECLVNFSSPWLFDSDSYADWFFREKFSIGDENEISKNKEKQMFENLQTFLGAGHCNDFTFVNWGVTYTIYKKI
jgi:SAM-dependent methyltransferase